MSYYRHIETGSIVQALQLPIEATLEYKPGMLGFYDTIGGTIGYEDDFLVADRVHGNLFIVALEDFYFNFKAYESD